MSDIAIALIDDAPQAHAFLRSCFASEGTASTEGREFSREGVLLAAEISLPFAGVAQNRVRTAIAGHKGPLVLFLDQDLKFTPDERLAIRDRLVELVKQVDHIDSPKALTFLEHIEESLTPYVDGIWIGVDVIRKPDINPLCVFIGSSTSIEDSRRILNVIASTCRKSGCVQVEQVPGGMSFAEVGSTFTPEVVWQKIIKPAAEQVRSMITSCCGSPDEDLSAYLKWIAKQHDPMIAAVGTGRMEEHLRPNLLPLLRISESDWHEAVWPNLNRIPQQGLEVFLRSGSTAREGLCASGAWLLALAAFQHAGPKRKWSTIFNPSDLCAEPSGWISFRITPILRVSGTLHDTIRRFFRMCRLLFEPKDDGGRGPLEEVRLTRAGLEFTLGFDAWNKDDPRGGLAEKLSRWRNGYLKGRNGNAWNNDLEAGPSSASRAILDWWLATSFNDFAANIPDDEAGDIFHHGDHWKITLKQIEQNADKKTKVIFS